MKLAQSRSSLHWHPPEELVPGNKLSLQIVCGTQHYAGSKLHLQTLQMALQLLKLVLGRPVAGISAPSPVTLLSQAMPHQIRLRLVEVIDCSARGPRRRQRPLGVVVQLQNQRQQLQPEASESRDQHEQRRVPREERQAQLVELSVVIAR